MSMAGMERGAVMRAREAEKAATRGMDRGVTMRAREAKKAATPQFGGSIPSPKQMTPAEARERALMESLQMQGFAPQQPPADPMQSGIGGMSQEEIDRLNQPVYDINDIIFGPETRGMNLIDMLVNSLRGGR